MKGQSVKMHGVNDAFELGIAIVHQELKLHSNMSVAENIYMGRLPKNRMGTVQYKKLYRQVEELLSAYGLKLNPHKEVRLLSIAEQQLTEIAKVLSYNAKVILMDEPTSSLTTEETQNLFCTMEVLKKKGVKFWNINTDELKMSYQKKAKEKGYTFDKKWQKAVDQILADTKQGGENENMLKALTKAENGNHVRSLCRYGCQFFCPGCQQKLFKLPITWFDEASTYCMIYMALIGTEIGLRDGTQIAVTAVVEKFHGRGKKMVQIISKNHCFNLFCYDPSYRCQHGRNTNEERADVSGPAAADGSSVCGHCDQFRNDRDCSGRIHHQDDLRSNYRKT